MAEKRVDFGYNALSQFTSVARHKDTDGGSGNEVATGFLLLRRVGICANARDQLGKTMRDLVLLHEKKLEIVYLSLESVRVFKGTGKEDVFLRCLKSVAQSDGKVNPAEVKVYEKLRASVAGLIWPTLR